MSNTNTKLKEKAKLLERHRFIKSTLQEAVARLGTESKQGLVKNRTRVKLMKRMLRLHSR